MKILYVTTISNTVNAFLIPHIKMLVDQGHQVDVAFNISHEVNSELFKLGCKVHEIGFQRSPLKKDNYIAYWKIKKLIIDEEYELVHVHTPVASFLTRLACRNLHDVKIIYTSHGLRFYKGAPLKNWVLFYPIEKWLSNYTDALITINKEDYNKAKSRFKAKNTKYIPGVGLDVNKLKNVVINIKTKRKEIGVPEDAFIVLSVGELNKNKNHEVIIRAISKLKNPKIHYVICGQGPLKNYLIELTGRLNLLDQVHLLGFRKDIAEICKSSDIFAFPSLREGLGMAALEAMACGLPIVTSNIHGINDYSVNGKTGFSCKPTDIDSFSKSIDILMKNKSKRQEFGEYNSKVIEQFDLTNTIDILKDIYKNI